MTSYDSKIWQSKDGDQTNFNSQFWSANVSELCLQTNYGRIQIPVAAPSPRSLFFQKKILNISHINFLDSFALLWFYQQRPNFIQGCYEVGINVGDPNFIQARVGIVSTQGSGMFDNIKKPSPR